MSVKRPDTVASPAAESRDERTFIPPPPREVRPPSDSVRVRIGWKSLRGVGKVLAVLGTILGGGVGGYGGHRYADKEIAARIEQNTAQTAQLQEQLKEHLKQAAVDKAELQHADLQHERDLQSVRLDYGVQLAEIRSTLVDIKDSIHRIDSRLDDQRGRGR